MLIRKPERREEVRAQMRGGNGDTHLLHAFAELPKNLRLTATVTLPPHAGIGVHEHVGETEFYVFINGSFRVTDDGVPAEVGPGDVMMTPSGHTHSVENLGDQEASFVAFIVLD